MLGFKVLVFLGVASGVFGGLVQQQLVKQVVQQPEPFDAYPQYNYGYSIQDPLTGDSKRQEETREGDVVKGQYSLVEPDGSLRTVTYTADVNGFNAVVTRTAGYAPAQVYSRVPFVASTPVQHFRPQVVFQPSRPVLQPLRPVQVHPVQQPIHFRPQPIQVQPVHPIHVQPQPVQPIQVQPVQPTYPQPPSDAEIVEQPQQPQQPQPVRPPPQQPQPIQPQPIQPQPQPIQPQPQPQPIRPPPQPVQPQPTFPQGPPEEAQSDDAVIVDNPVARRADAGAGQQTNGGQSSFSVRSSRDGQYNFNFGF